LSSYRIEFINKSPEFEAVLIGIDFINLYLASLFDIWSDRHQKFSDSKVFELLMNTYLGGKENLINEISAPLMSIKFCDEFH